METQITAQMLGLKEDLEKEYKQINIQVDSALNYVASEMKENLRKHLWEDWHEVWFPKEYIRRTDNPSYGRPLGGEKNFHVEVKNGLLSFEYNPIGDHHIDHWHTRDGDKIITAIQTGKLLGSPPPRPFWNNFVEEQINGGILESFIKGMSAKYQVEINQKDKSDLNDIASRSFLPEGNWFEIENNGVKLDT